MWLSKFEEHFKKHKLGMYADYEVRRMARVIRELVGCLETFEGSPSEWSVESHVAFSNLSPDAKELLDG